MQVNGSLKDLLRVKIEAREGQKKKDAIADTVKANAALCNKYAEVAKEYQSCGKRMHILSAKLKAVGLEGMRSDDWDEDEETAENFQLTYEQKHKRHLRPTEEILDECIVELTYSKGDEKKLIEAILKKIERL
jgi:hypothetical protein